MRFCELTTILNLKGLLAFCCLGLLAAGEAAFGRAWPVTTLEKAPMAVHEFIKQFGGKPTQLAFNQPAFARKTPQPSQAAAFTPLQQLLNTQELPLAHWLAAVSAQAQPAPGSLEERVASSGSEESSGLEVEPASEAQGLPNQVLETPQPSAPQAPLFASAEVASVEVASVEAPFTALLPQEPTAMDRLPATPATPPLAAVEPAAATLTVSQDAWGRFYADPQQVRLGLDQWLGVHVDAATQVRVHVRDGHLLEWDPDQGALRGLAPGKTEVYLSFPEQMLILPAIVADQEAPVAVAVEEAPVAESPAGLPDPKRQAFALAHTKEVSQVSAKAQASQLALQEKSLAYEELQLQVLDVGAPGAGRGPRYAAGVRMQILGTEYEDLTNVRGESPWRLVPVDNRFFVAMTDPNAFYAPSVVEIVGPHATEGPVQRLVKLMPSNTLEHLRAAQGLSSDPYQASLCGLALDAAGEPMSGVQAFGRYSPDAGVDATYTGPAGLVTGEATVTAADGRFCFLALEPGPMTVEFSHAGGYLGAIPTTVFPGHHLEEDFTLAASTTLVTSLSVLPAAKDLSATPSAPLKRPLTTGVDLTTVGDQTLMEEAADSTFTAVSSQLSHKGKVCFVSDSPGFEYGFHCLNQGSRPAGALPVATLLPSGFALSAFFASSFTDSDASPAQAPVPVSLDPEFGHVFVEHGSFVGERRNFGRVSFELFDFQGERVGYRAALTEQPGPKALFFNLEQGAYTVMVRSEHSGEVLSVTTVTVYPDTVSYANTGRPLVYTPPID